LGTILTLTATTLGALSALNASIIASARISYALARDDFFPSSLKRLRRKYKSPYFALVASTLIITVITLADAITRVTGFEIDPIEFTTYLSDFGYIMGLSIINGATIYVRRKQPHRFRPFKVPFYPLTPVLAIISTFALVFTLDWKGLAFGGILTLIVLLVYLLKQRRSNKNPRDAPNERRLKPFVLMRSGPQEISAEAVPPKAPPQGDRRGWSLSD